MRRACALGVAAVALGSVVVAACGSSGGHTVAGSTIAGSTIAGSTTTAKGANPNAAELNAAGDIPDNQAYVKYTASTGAYSLSFPEGWARTDSGETTTFSAHFNSIVVSATRSPAAPTIASATANEVPALQRSVAGFTLGKVAVVTRPAGRAVFVTYAATSAPDQVTAKRVMLDVERYEFWHNGTQVTLTLSAPHGADNVDPWRKVTGSFAWAK